MGNKNFKAVKANRKFTNKDKMACGLLVLGVIAGVALTLAGIGFIAGLAVCGAAISKTKMAARRRKARNKARYYKKNLDPWD